MSKNNSVKRHLLKTITYRLISSGATFLIGFVFTKSFSVSALISVSELLFKPIIYFIHERVWYKHIRIGRKQTDNKI